ncbi:MULTISPECIES: LuxR family transcriptional regulator [Shinella]|uniref:helix-turn-helix transcriptional regulator n=2 Tax=Rhizobiaceae TaxID=82115 RepID=UPI0007DA75F4|nr:MULTISPECIES: LuxR family transcriptional regulator [Shinella]ANH09086.1 histidine kinase [Shinella sp. HZN7]MDC7260278.1 LuxR family transcriptional regulator [Shinella sp. YE25]CAI0341819.1 Histidine kinase [Rhizobiaceae bacterium]CAK7262280.1 Histidine kinase [Shinella sp. WSC3-e]
MDDRSYLSLTLGELQTLSEPGELSGALHAVRTRYGLSHMTFLVVRRGAGPSAAPYYCSTYPEEWIATYFANDYLAIDPVIDIARWGLLPVDWSTLDQRASRVRRLFDEARAYGIGPNGLTVPIRGANGERCLFSVTSDWSGSDWLALCAANLHDLHILSHYLHEKVLTLSGLRRPVLVRELSRRERQCLQLLASGKIYKQIAVILGISESAVHLYMRSARRKLGATTSYHAVAKASYLELVDV